MIIEKALQDAITANADLTALLGERVYITWTDKAVKMPYLIIHEISSPENEFVPVVTSRIQMSVFAGKIIEAKEILSLLHSIFKGFKGILSGVSVHRMILDNVGHQYDSEHRIHHYPIDYLVQYSRS